VVVVYLVSLVILGLMNWNCTKFSLTQIPGFQPYRTIRH